MKMSINIIRVFVFKKIIILGLLFIVVYLWYVVLKMCFNIEVETEICTNIGVLEVGNCGWSNFFFYELIKCLNEVKVREYDRFRWVFVY